MVFRLFGLRVQAVELVSNLSSLSFFRYEFVLCIDPLQFSCIRNLLLPQYRIVGVVLVLIILDSLS